jgi:hypothetical protein
MSSSEDAVLEYGQCTSSKNGCETQYGYGVCESTLTSISSSYDITKAFTCNETVCKEGALKKSLGTTNYCAPERNFLKISVNNNTTIMVRSEVNYPFLITMSAEQSLDPTKSSIQPVNGTCIANSTWAPLNTKISPWTYTKDSQATHFTKGINQVTFSSDNVEEMAGCTWQACIHSNKNIQSCMALNFMSNIEPEPQTCDPLLKPANTTISKTCTNNPNISFSETTTYSCNQTNLQWVGTTTNNSQAVCVAQTACSGSAPAPTQVSLTCSSKFGSSYSGNYTETTTTTCNTSNFTWSIITKTDDSNVTCNNRLCPGTQPAARNTTLTCASKLGATYTGNYTETETTNCNTTNYTWTLISKTDNSASVCTQRTCAGSAPSPTQETLTCASKLGATYTGNYTETTTTSCNTSNYTWTLISKSDNSESACKQRTCAPPAPNSSTTTHNCSSLGSGFSGQYTETKSYQCNQSSLQWNEVITNTQSECQNSMTKLTSLQVVGGVLEVPAGVNAYIDGNINVSQLKINGTLKCAITQKINLIAETIFVNSTGVFECGTENAPFAGDLTISLKRNASIIPKTGRELNGTTISEAAKAALASHTASTVGFRALLVTGQLKLYGQAKGNTSRLTQTANPGSTTLQVDQAPNWKVNDEIAIASTSFNPSEDEKLKITNISGTTITLDRPLQFSHFGGAIETFTNSGVNLTLNQKAEVVNLTRNIKIEAYDKLSDGTDANQLNPDQETSEPGGHVMVHQGGFAQISAVEFYKMGQAGIMARYPFHWHRLGDTNNQYIKNSSIHNSFQRCVTIHATNNTLVENNICYNFRGHGYFLEDGIEVNNTLKNNIGFGGKIPHLSKNLLSSDNPDHGVGLRFPAASTYWISHPQNTVTNNIAAGSQGTGFWNAFEANSINVNTTSFANNIAHTNLVGHTWDGAPGTTSTINPNNYDDRRITEAYYKPPVSPTFNRLVAYKNSQAGIYFRGSTATYTEAVLADNYWSLFLAYNQVVKNSVVIGKSNHVATQPRGHIGNLAHIGIVLYDGPFELENVDFINFNNQPAAATSSNDLNYIPFYAIGGSEKLVNMTRGLRFIPEVNFRMLLEDANDPWIDKKLSQAVRDIDGSLTGVAGGIALSRVEMTHESNCTLNNKLIGFTVCPQSTNVGFFLIHSGSYGGYAGISNPYVIRKNNTIQSLTESEINNIRNSSQTSAYLNRKTVLINSSTNKYDLIFSDDFSIRNKFSDMLIRYYSENGETVSPILKIKNYGSQCRLTIGNPVYSMTELMNSQQTSYFSQNSSFFIKIRPTNLFGNVTAGYGRSSPLYGDAVLECSQSYNPATDTVNHGDSGGGVGDTLGRAVRGVIDGVSADGNIGGWACIAGQATAIDLHIYAMNAAGKQTQVGITTANANSEPAVGQACSDSTLSPHRFNFRPPNSNFSGQKIYIYGINGTDNPLINNSGSFTFK